MMDDYCECGHERKFHDELDMGFAPCQHEGCDCEDWRLADEDEDSNDVIDLTPAQQADLRERFAAFRERKHA